MPTATVTPLRKIPVGLSACLAGQDVRYNGGHCHSKLCMHTLGLHFDFKTFCPEVAAGFGTPRPSLRLTGDPAAPRLRFSDEPQNDVTDQFNTAVSPYLNPFAELDGYILMKNSPSCGLERIKVYQDNGHAHLQRRAGLFTEMLQDRYPLLPVEEEGRLNDAQLRENFILRVYAHFNFRHEVLADPSYHKLLAFHSGYKYVVMAHSQTVYRQLGRMLAESHDRPLPHVLDDYFEALLAALAKPASRKGHSNVLLHILGYLKKSVDSRARQKIVDTIDAYRLGNIPLVTPLTLIRHYIDMKGSNYIRAQRYLAPYPDELGLRNAL